VLKLELPVKLDVLIVLGSISDQAIAKQMTPVFAEFGACAYFEVCSAHRDHERLATLVPAAEKSGARVIIGVAGMAAHLPGVIAAMTTLPVIGVPAAGSLEGLDALLSIAQMPPGIPVATVAVGGGKNAALLAVEIRATADPALRGKLAAYRTGLKEKNRQAGSELRDSLAQE
jgi:5-(carboxyamino)imidazole ribonucleotide mutase